MKKISKKVRILLVCFCLLFAGLRLASLFSKDSDDVQEVEYTEFLEMVEQGKVDTVYYSGSNDYMEFTLYNEDTKGMSREELEEYEYKSADKRTTLYPSYEEFRKDLLESGVHVEYVDSASILDIVPILVNLVFPILLIVFLARSMKNSPFGESVDKSDLIQTSDVKFSDVIGQDEVIEDIKFIAKLIKNPKIGNDVGAKLPKGILLSGEPGTGKTLIAKAIAHEAGVPFISMSGSDFKELFVGMGAKRVRDLFKLAKENAPCIVFIDEIDAIGSQRDGGYASSSEDSQTINALLKEMDGFSGREGVFVIAATNRPKALDSALKRPGRFDREIIISMPRDWRVRLDIFKHYLNMYSLSDDVDIEGIAKQCGGFSGADIAMICNEASIIAVIKGLKCITNDCIEEAIDKKIFKGNRSKEDRFDKDKKVIAYHEAGHAVMTYLLGSPISRASIIGTTSGVGGAVFHEESDSCLLTEEELLNRVKICYGGRASEELFFSSVTTGASNDISQATGLLKAYVGQFGFDKSLGLVDLAKLSESALVEPSLVIDRVSGLARNCYQASVSLLYKNKDLIDALATKLLEVETMSGDEIVELLKSVESKRS